MNRPKVNGARLWQRLHDLAEITEPDRPWTRQSFTPMFLRGRAWLEQEFVQAGLAVETDVAGNLIGRFGSGSNQPPVVLGSHSDTVPSGGRFDGVLGVLCALEVAQTLIEHDQKLGFPLEVIDFLAEELSAFGLSCIGSRAFGGKLDADMLNMTRADGMTLRDAIAYVGGDPDRIAEARRAEGSTAAYLEVHIEQARSLEAADIPLGIVTGIAAITRERITIKGQTDHAGATPMALRRDALVGAADLIRAVWDMANKANGQGDALVATIGWIENTPNAASAVPGKVDLILEARCTDADKLARFLSLDLRPCFAGLVQDGFDVARHQLSNVGATQCDERLVQVIAGVVRANNIEPMFMPSGAGHDGVFVAHTGPIGMIFIPCKGGLSHNPDEWANEKDCALAAQTMLDAVLALAQPSS